MGGDVAGTEPAPSAAARCAAERATLVELLGDLPETRLSKATPRHGWTLRHELAWLAAADEELIQRLELAVNTTTDEPHWRRVRGEAMHAAQEMRLAALREHLEGSGARVVASLEAHTERLEDPAISAAIQAHLDHGNAAIQTLKGVLGI